MVNWEQQWELFAPGFKNGLAHINLGTKTLLLKPGAGFGDLSHPTTRLMLKLMKPHVKNHFILDIGCGSGILSLAALLLEAKKVIGIDIDNDAIAHAKENGKLNKLEVTFTRPEHLKLQERPLILMNMILSEQLQAYNPLYNGDTIITSGILDTQKEKYLELAKNWGWKFLEMAQEKEWLAFRFKT